MVQRLRYKFKIACVAMLDKLEVKHQISFIFSCFEITTFVKRILLLLRKHYHDQQCLRHY